MGYWTARLRYVQAFSVQTAHTAVANGRANIQERLARWILMSHYRSSCNTMGPTHEFLSLRCLACHA
jgi:hypothetical protein